MNVLQDDLRSSEPALEGTQARMARLTEAMAVEEAAAEVARRAMRHQEQICQVWGGGVGGWVGGAGGEWAAVDPELFLTPTTPPNRRNGGIFDHLWREIRIGTLHLSVGERCQQKGQCLVCEFIAPCGHAGYERHQQCMEWAKA